MERTERAVVLTADVGWSDVGEWSSVWRLSPRDANGNSLRGRAVVIDSSNVLVRSEEQLAAVIGLHDVIVVATGDAVLVADRSQTAKVKMLVERLKALGIPAMVYYPRPLHRQGPYARFPVAPGGLPVTGRLVGVAAIPSVPGRPGVRAPHPGTGRSPAARGRRCRFDMALPFPADDSADRIVSQPVDHSNGQSAATPAWMRNVAIAP